MADAKTLAAYAPRVQAYVDVTPDASEVQGLEAFATRLPPAARVLDLGCGPGLHAAALMARGFEVEAIDATPAFVAEAQRRGVDARLGTFDDVDSVAAYDGIWASFSLLHAPASAFPRHMAALSRALKPGGHLFLGMKLGQGETRDSLGRFYAYYPEEELRAAMVTAGLHPVWHLQGEGPGLAGDVAPFVLLIGEKHA